MLAHGGSANGYALTLAQGRAAFLVRSGDALATAIAAEKLGAGWKHLVGVLAEDGAMSLYVDGGVAATARAPGLVAKQPVQTLELGGDSQSSVGDYPPGASYTGLIDEVAIYHRMLGADEIAARFEKPGSVAEGAAIACSFDDKSARDISGGGNDGAVGQGIDSGKGIVGSALWVPRPKSGVPKQPKTDLPASRGSFVQHEWTGRVPMYTRAMALAGDTLIIAGPPDIIDEEYTFARLAEGDADVHKELEAQDAALEGEAGGLMQTVSTSTGEQGPKLELDTLPVWDGMAIARGQLFVSGKDGSVRCFGK